MEEHNLTNSPGSSLSSPKVSKTLNPNVDEMKSILEMCCSKEHMDQELGMHFLMEGVDLKRLRPECVRELKRFVRYNEERIGDKRLGAVYEFKTNFIPKSNFMKQFRSLRNKVWGLYGI
jgi:hypothetical protein